MQSLYRAFYHLSIIYSIKSVNNPQKVSIQRDGKEFSPSDREIETIQIEFEKTNSLTSPAGACILKEKKGVLPVKETKGICATPRGWYWFHLALGVFSVGYGTWYAMASHGYKGWMLTVCGVCIFCVGVYHLIVQYHLDGDGITVRRFGKSVRFLAWRDVAQVHRIHRQKSTVLMVTPSVCPAFRPGGTCDGHLSECKGQAILLDDSKQNRAYIEQVWGKIVILDFKGYPMEEPKR